jgi:hypothetical protein
MITYYNAAENPIKLWLRDPTLATNGGLVDFSIGSWTFVFKLGHAGAAALLTKSSGLVGAAGVGVEPTGTPNFVATPTADEFLALSGLMMYQVRATSASADEFFQGQIQMLQVIT